MPDGNLLHMPAPEFNRPPENLQIVTDPEDFPFYQHVEEGANDRASAIDQLLHAIEEGRDGRDNLAIWVKRLKGVLENNA